MGEAHREHAKDIVDAALKQASECLVESGARLVILGDRGSGKSSCVNAAFGTNVAAAGAGRSITDGISLYEASKSCPVNIYDTKGFETLSGNEGSLDQLQALVEERNRAVSLYDVDDPRAITEQLHAIWWIISVIDGGRFNGKSIEQLGKILTRATNKVPIIMVLNKCDANQEFVWEVERQVKEDCIWAASVVRVAADPKHGPLNQLCEKCGSPDISISSYRGRYVCNDCKHDDSFKKSYGLDELVKVTVGHLPGVVATSFLAAQKVWLEGLDRVAIRDICGFALTAGGIGAAPIPALTRLVLYPVQYAMVLRLASIYGVILSFSAGLHLAGSLSVISLGGLAGWGVATVLKCIPGLTLAGMATDAVVSSSVTLVMGLVTKALLRRVRSKAMCSSDEELSVTPEALAEIMSDEERQSLFSEYFGRLKPALAALFAEGVPSSEALENAAVAAEGADLRH